MKALLILLVLLGTTRTAAAGCPRPGAPLDEVCRPWTAMLLPTAFAAVYLPGDDTGPWLGGGVEVTALAWSDSSEALGPSHGRIRFDIGILRSGDEDIGSMVMYRGGAQVSIERNAARRWLIPYVATDLGGLWTDALGSRAFVDAGLGVYLLHRRSLILDLEATYLLPFADVDDVAGVRGQLSLSVALW